MPSGARRLAGDADWSPLAPRSCTTRARLPEAAAVSHAPTPPSLPPLRVRGNRRTSRGRCPPRRRRKRCPCRLVSPGRGGLRPVTTLSRPAPPPPMRAQVPGDDASPRKTAADGSHPTVLSAACCPHLSECSGGGRRLRYLTRGEFCT